MNDESFSRTIKLEKYLALVTGNVLYNDDGRLFIRKFNGPIISELLKQNIYTWARKSFKGVYLKEEEGAEKMTSPRLNGVTLLNYQFVDCHFENVIFFNCLLMSCKFLRCTFINVEFSSCRLDMCRFSECSFIGFFNLYKTSIGRYGYIPLVLSSIASKNLSKKFGAPDEMRPSAIQSKMSNIIIFQLAHEFVSYFDAITFYLNYLLTNKLASKELIIKFYSTYNPQFADLIKKCIESIAKTGKISDPIRATVLGGTSEEWAEISMLEDSID